MFLSNDFVFIPLFGVSGICFLLLIFLILIKRRKSARVSYIFILSDIIELAGSLIAAFRIRSGGEDALSLFVLATVLCAFLLIPYCLIMLTFEPRKFEVLVPRFVNKKAENRYKEALQIQSQQTLIETKENDSEILNICLGFSQKESEAFANEDGMSALLNYINKTVKNKIKADGGAVLLIDDFEDIIKVRSFEGDFPPPYRLPDNVAHTPLTVATYFKDAVFPLRDNIFGEIATSGKTELVSKPEEDNRIYQNSPEEFLECGSYIFAPLQIQKRVIGLLAFARLKSSAPFTADDLKTVSVLSRFAAVSVRGVISVRDLIEKLGIGKESEIIQKIQDILHPSKLPVISSLQIGTLWNPMGEVCADFYDVIPSRKDRVSFILGDIAGKGLNSVVVMPMIRAMVRLVVNTKQSAATILEWVNHSIASESFSTDHFASCALINYDPVKRIADIATGGTMPVFYYASETDTIKQLTSNSEPIGVKSTSAYSDILQEVKTDDIIIVYTDGLIEALNERGEQYTKERLLNVIKSNSKADAKDIANNVKSDVKSFIGNADVHDDQTLLILKF